MHGAPKEVKPSGPQNDGNFLSTPLLPEHDQHFYADVSEELFQQICTSIKAVSKTWTSRETFHLDLTFKILEHPVSISSPLQPTSILLSSPTADTADHLVVQVNWWFAEVDVAWPMVNSPVLVVSWVTGTAANGSVLGGSWISSETKLASLYVFLH